MFGRSGVPDIKGFLFLIIPLLLGSCNGMDNHGRFLKRLVVVNADAPVLIDRGQTVAVLFEVVPKDFAFQDQEVSLQVSGGEALFRLSGIEKRDDGLYVALIEDLDEGEPYQMDVSVWIGNKESNPFVMVYHPREYDFSILTNETIYDNDTHSAFTGLVNYRGTLYLAFREGTAHRPATVADYGVIKVLSNDGMGWKECAIIKDETRDLRDPFLIEVDGKLRMYIGYNTFEGEIYRHSGSVYVDYEDGIWGGIKMLTHDVPHIVWLWKVRQYKDRYYSVAYLEGEYPALLESEDGVAWDTVTLFGLEGELSEADMGFIGRTMYVCLRKDKPVGTPSWWGVAEYPFKAFSWKEMDTCVESPEFLRMPYSNNLLWLVAKGFLSREKPMCRCLMQQCPANWRE